MDKKKDNQIGIRIICVIASFIFWLYIANTENPQIDRLITVQVTIENADALAKSKLVLINDPKFEVSFRVKGPMLEVNALNADKFSLKADLSSGILTKGSNKIPVYVDSMPANIDIIEQENLKINIRLDNLIDKSVPVTVEVPVETKPGFAAFDPIYRPSMVTVSGAEEYVKNVSYVQARTELKDIEKDEELNLRLQAYDEAGRVIKDVNIDPETVNVVIPVRKTKTVNISVETTGNIGQNLMLESIQAIPDKIDIAGDVEVLNSIFEIQTEPIDLSEITEDKDIEVRLVLDKVVTVSGINSVSVRVNVDNIKQKNLSTNILFNNLGDNLEYSTDNSNVSLVLLGAESLMQDVTESNIKCTVDLSNLDEGTHSIPVNIVVPSGVKIESASPKNVEVTITKKQQEEETPVNTSDPDVVTE